MCYVGEPDMTRNAILSRRIPKDQITLTGESVIEARRLVSLSKIPKLEVYCIFCFHRGELVTFAKIDVMGELEHLWKCPKCYIQMTRGTLMGSFSPRELGFFIGYYDRFWGRVQNHNQWMERFKMLFTYEERQKFWEAYYEARPKREQSVSDNV